MGVKERRHTYHSWKKGLWVWCASGKHKSESQEDLHRLSKTVICLDQTSVTDVAIYICNLVLLFRKYKGSVCECVYVFVYLSVWGCGTVIRQSHHFCTKPWAPGELRFPKPTSHWYKMWTWLFSGWFLPLALLLASQRQSLSREQLKGHFQRDSPSQRQLCTAHIMCRKLAKSGRSFAIKVPWTSAALNILCCTADVRSESFMQSNNLVMSTNHLSIWATRMPFEQNKPNYLHHVGQGVVHFCRRMPVMFKCFPRKTFSFFCFISNHKASSLSIRNLYYR